MLLYGKFIQLNGRVKWQPLVSPWGDVGRSLRGIHFWLYLSRLVMVNSQKREWQFTEEKSRLGP